VYSEKTPDDGQRNCPKHVELYSKNKFEKLEHLFGFIIRISWKVCFDSSCVELIMLIIDDDRLCGLVVRVSGYRYRGPGFDPRRYQIF